MKRIFNIIALATAIFATSCIKDGYLTEANYDFKVNYETFWNLFNENYCFMGENFGYTKNVDWYAVREEMMPKVEAATTEEELLEIMGQSIDKLKDGHIWIDTKFNHRGCFTFYEKENGVKYPENFISSSVVKEYYLDNKYQYRTRNGQRFGNITRNGKTFFYLYHSDFTKGLTAEDMEVMKPHVDKADGFIYDVRTNPGGNTQLAFDIAGMFMKERTHVGYDVVKTGKGYNDLSEPAPIYVEPNYPSLKWYEKPTVLLTNRDVYSTANEFTCFMKQAPNVTLIGGITGGGGGNPTSYYLPNGWTVVMSAATLTLDVDKKQIEAGVEPDIYVEITEQDKTNKIDTILERAIEELSK